MVTMNKNYDVSKYVTDPDITSIAGRIAHFLDWAAKKYPGTYFHPTIILQAIMGYARAPRANSRDVFGIKNSMSNAHRLLMKNYSRGIVTEPSVGHRATTTADDAIKNTVTKRARQLNNAKTQLNAALSIVNPKEISSTEEGKALKEYYFNLKSSTKALFSEEFERRLLPPKTPDPEDDPKKKKPE